MPKTILKVESLKVKLEKEDILENLSFEVKEGDIFTILGPNGAGKTVLLKTLLGILPHEGKIKWEKGIKIGYVPQRLPFMKDVPVSVEEFFELKKIAREKTKEILDLVGFSGNFSEKKMGDLSSGQFQRVLIGWALAGNPEVLLFDEPTTGIDIGGEETIYTLLSKLKEEKNLTILLVTHDLSVVSKFSNFVVCLNKCPICQGVPQEVLTLKKLHELYGEEIKFYGHHKH
ncbi:MAG: metal ABC transporter ATP-binding protein [Candidatus Moranbacteria bacterium]|nr:metal ABC transporter ATP-binding protein [Candidatus Moranbacteria bacterium]